MSANTLSAKPGLFSVGWWILMAICALSAAGHLALLFAIPGEELLFLGWTVVSAYAAVVLAIPYRRGERWAWYTSWLIVLTFALVPLYSTEQGPIYLAVGVVMAVCQLLTRAYFYPR